MAATQQMVATYASKDTPGNWKQAFKCNTNDQTLKCDSLNWFEEGYVSLVCYIVDVKFADMITLINVFITIGCSTMLQCSLRVTFRQTKISKRFIFNIFSISNGMNFQLER